MLETTLSAEVPPGYYPISVDRIGRLASNVRVAVIKPAHHPRELPGWGKLPVYVYCDAVGPMQVGIERALDDSLEIRQEQAVTVISRCLPGGDAGTIGRALVCLLSGVWRWPENSSEGCGHGPLTFVTRTLDDLPQDFLDSYRSEAKELVDGLSAIQLGSSERWIVYRRFNQARPGDSEIATHSLAVFRVDVGSPPSRATPEVEKEFGAPLYRYD